MMLVNIAMGSGLLSKYHSQYPTSMSRFRLAAGTVATRPLVRPLSHRGNLRLVIHSIHFTGISSLMLFAPDPYSATSLVNMRLTAFGKYRIVYPLPSGGLVSWLWSRVPPFLANRHQLVRQLPNTLAENTRLVTFASMILIQCSLT
jgi:hypothetical protein